VPEWLNRVLRSPALLRQVARLAGLTSPRDLGESTLSMLRGESGHQAHELDRLIQWLQTQAPPDVLYLSNSLLSGMARRLKERLHCPIVCALQGEDSFLDGLPEPYRQQAWELLAQRCQEIDHFMAISQYFGDLMRGRLGLDASRVSVVYPGIAVNEFAPAPTAPLIPTIGFLARMHPTKGLDTLVDAFILLRKINTVPGLRLRIAGAQTGADARYVQTLEKKLIGQRLQNEVDWLPNLDLKTKAEFLRSLTVLSVPATYGEAFGLYVLEALATGVPVVQPRHGAFAEVLAQTGGGLLCDPDSPKALAERLEELLRNPFRAHQLGAAGCVAVQQKFDTTVMAQKTETVFQALEKPL